MSINIPTGIAPGSALRSTPGVARSRSTLDDLIAEALRIVREEGEPIRLAVPRTLEHMRPDNEASEHLWRVGLQAIVNHRINAWATGKDAEAAENPAEIGTTPGRRRTGESKPNRILVGLGLINTRNYEGADGRRKVLADFTLADVVHLQNLAESRSEGYRMLYRAARAAAAFMRPKQINRLGDLPEEDRRKIGLYLVAVPEEPEK